MKNEFNVGELYKSTKQNPNLPEGTVCKIFQNSWGVDFYPIGRKDLTAFCYPDIRAFENHWEKA